MKQFDITKIQNSLIAAGRRKTRIEKTAFLSVISSFALISFFVFFLFDYITNFPWPVRILLSLGIFAYFAVYLPRKKKRYFHRRDDLIDIAREVELRASNKKEGGFNSILISAVEFAKNSSVFGSEDLKDRTVREAHSSEFDPMKLELHDTNLVRLALKALLVLFIVYSVWGALGYGSMGVFFARALGLPLQYPTKTKIVRIIYPKSSPQYKSIKILTQAAGVIPSEGTISVAYEGESAFTVPSDKAALMNSFESVVKEPEKSFSFRVRLGDAESPKYNVKVVRPPYITESSIKVTPPEYTGEKEKKFPIGNFEALENSQINISVTPDRKVKSCVLEIREKDQDNKSEYPMKQNGNLYSIEKINLKNSKTYSIKLTDEDQVENEDRIFYLISVMQDHLPLVKLDKPIHGSYYAPVSKINWIFKCSDDFGISSAVLHYTINTKTENGEERKIREGDIKVKGLKKGEKEAVFSGSINLLELNLSPDMTVTFQALVKDVCDFRGKDEHGKSTVNTINIVSPEELRAILDEGMLHMNKMVDDVQTDIKHQVKILEMFTKEKNK